MDKIIIIAGATASGKTAVALSLAHRIGGEIISADSMQVYRGMDIGTAKPSPSELAAIPHHLVSIINPSDQFSAAEFQSRATQAILEIRARGRVPIIAGGTGFYINALLYGAEFSDNPAENELRPKFEKLARERGAEFLHAKLAAADPEYAASLHANNIKRVARALAYCEATGKLFSAHNAEQKEKPRLFDAAFFKLSLPRDVLYSRINARTQAMFDGGLVEEVQNLLAAGFCKNLASMQGIGYKETVQYLAGEIPLADAIAQTAQATRNYAKRQETWLRNRSARSLEAGSNFPAHEKARQARSGHRGHMSKSAHSLEAGSNFPAHEKARQARSGHRGHMSKSAHSLEAGSNFPAHEKTANEIAAELEAVFRNSVSG